MNWKDLGKTVGKYAPLIGNLLPIPGAGIAGTLLAAAFGTENTPDAIHAAIQADPDAAIKLAKIEADNHAALQAQVLSAETLRIQSVNSSMQAESKSEHWAQWLWRPYNGFLFGTTLFMVYALPAIINTLAPATWAKPILKEVTENGITVSTLVGTWAPIQYATIPDMVFVVWGSVLGVTAWQRGSTKPAGLGK